MWSVTRASELGAAGILHYAGDAWTRSGSRKSSRNKEVTLQLDERPVAYFEGLAEETEIPFRTLIKLYLREVCRESEAVGPTMETGGVRNATYTATFPHINSTGFLLSSPCGREMADTFYHTGDRNGFCPHG